MKYFKYETHLHTAEVSKCARVSAEEQVEFYSELGYEGIIVTDHFFNGNTVIPREGLPWEEMVDRFCEGYNNAKKAGEKYGIDVFFGWEYSFLGTDFLTYGLSPEWLLQNPQIMDMTHWDYLEYARGCGALVIHAHPFRQASYIREIRLQPDRVDGVEVINANRTDFENKMAADYAKNYNLISFAGTDNHVAFAQDKLAGIKTTRKLESIEDFVDVILSGKYKIFSEKA